MSFMSAKAQQAQQPDPGGAIGSLPPGMGAPVMGARCICVVNPESELDNMASGARFSFDDRQVDLQAPSGEIFTYGFDAVMPPKSPQDKVFQEVAREAVLQAVGGFTSAAFIALGCSGSGKTFAVTGGAKRFADRGLIPRSISVLFEGLGMRPDRDEYEVAVSFFEIYKDAVVDLLSERRRRVTLQKGAHGPVLLGLLRQTALTESDAYHLLFQGDSNRHFERFPLNAETSRGHVFYVLHLTHVPSGREISLSFIDLAAVISTRNHATTSIERSMEALRAVAASMQAGVEEPPWDVSLLTQLLQPLLQPRLASARPHIALINPIRFADEQAEEIQKYLELTEQLCKALDRLDRQVAMGLPQQRVDAVAFESTTTIDPSATLQWDMAPVDPSQFPVVEASYTAPGRSTPPNSPVNRGLAAGIEDKIGAHITDQPLSYLQANPEMSVLQTTETIESNSIEVDLLPAQPPAFPYSPQPTDGDDYGPNMVGARTTEPLLTSVPPMTSLPPASVPGMASLPPTAVPTNLAPLTSLPAMPPAAPADLISSTWDGEQTAPPPAPASEVTRQTTEIIAGPALATENLVVKPPPVIVEPPLEPVNVRVLDDNLVTAPLGSYDAAMTRVLDSTMAATSVMSSLPPSTLPPMAATQAAPLLSWSKESGVEATSASELRMPQMSLLSMGHDSGPLRLSARAPALSSGSSQVSAAVPLSRVTTGPSAPAFRPTSDLGGNDKRYVSDGTFVRTITDTVNQRGSVPVLPLDGLDYSGLTSVSGALPQPPSSHPSRAGSHTLPVKTALTTSTISTFSGPSTTRSTPVMMRAPAPKQSLSNPPSFVASSFSMSEMMGASGRAPVEYPPVSEPRGRSPMAVSGVEFAALRMPSTERLPSQGPPARAVQAGPARAVSRSVSPMPPRSPDSRSPSPAPAVSRYVTSPYRYRSESPSSSRVFRRSTAGAPSARTNAYAVSTFQSPIAVPSGATTTEKVTRARSPSPLPQDGTSSSRALSPQVTRQSSQYLVTRRYAPQPVTSAWAYDAPARSVSPQRMADTSTTTRYQPRSLSPDQRITLGPGASISSSIYAEPASVRKLEELASNEKYGNLVRAVQSPSTCTSFSRVEGPSYARAVEGPGTYSQTITPTLTPGHSFYLPSTPTTSAPPQMIDGNPSSGRAPVWTSSQQPRQISPLPLPQELTPGRPLSPMGVSISQEADSIRNFSPQPPAPKGATGRNLSPMPPNKYSGPLGPLQAGQTPVVPWMWGGSPTISTV